MHSNLSFRFEIIRGFAFASFAFLFQKEKHIKETKQLVQDFIPPPSIHTYTRVLCTHIQIHTCRDLVHLDFLGPQGVSSRPLGLQLSTPSVQCVCLCAYTQTPTYTPTHVKKREDTDNTLSLLLSKINPYAKQRVPS